MIPPFFLGGCLRVGVSPSMAHEELWGWVQWRERSPLRALQVVLQSPQAAVTVVRIGVGRALWSLAATQGGCK